MQPGTLIWPSSLSKVNSNNSPDVFDCTERENPRACAEEHLTRIGDGAGRTTYTDGRYVLKLADRPRGQVENINEESIWENTNKETRQYLSEVHRVGPDGQWLVMDHEEEIVTGVGSSEPEQSEVTELLRKQGITCVELAPKSSRGKFFDYGQCYRPEHLQDMTDGTTEENIEYLEKNRRPF